MSHPKKTCFISRAVQRLIAINRIHNKSLCLHNICVCVFQTPLKNKNVLTLVKIPR